MNDLSKMVDATHFFNQPHPDQTKLFLHKMLSFPLRDYVIKKIKDPLRIAILKAGSFWSYIILFYVIIQSARRLSKKVGKVTKENSIYITTHLLLEHKERFKQIHHNPGRDRMIESAFDIIIAGNEHDVYYQYILGWEAKQIYNDIQAGRWPLDTRLPKVLSPCWKKENKDA